MVDTLVTADVYTSADAHEALWGPYWQAKDIGYIVFANAGKDISYARTADAGATWADTLVQAGSMEVMAVWRDRETPGDTGNLLHIAWTDDSGSDDVRYVNLDLSTETLGTIRTVTTAISSGTSVTNNHMFLFCKTRNGNLILGFATAVDNSVFRSTDGGVNWFVRTGTAYDAPDALQDYALGFCAKTADDADGGVLYWDGSASEISVKMYDDSADTWTETVVVTGMTKDENHINMGLAVRHSDGAILWAAHSDDDNSSDDLRTGEIIPDSLASPTITAKTNIFTNQAESAQTFVWINQQNDEVRVGHLKGSPTWQATTLAVFHISTNGMTSWGAEQAYGEDTADDFRRFTAGRTVDDAGGRFQPVFYNDDLGNIYVNENNDAEITAAGGGGGFAHSQGVIVG